MSMWKNVSGGCKVGRNLPEYPCDNEYENTETKERVTVYSTQKCHFNMPEFVSGPAELYSLDGVRPKESNDE